MSKFEGPYITTPVTAEELYELKKAAEAVINSSDSEQEGEGSTGN